MATPPVSTTFVTLPFEIRHEIYSLLLSDLSLHLTTSPSTSALVLRAPLPDNAQHLLSLPLVCKQIYAEVLPLLYTTATFHLDGPHTLIRFFATTPPRIRTSLRSLHLTYPLSSDTLPNFQAISSGKSPYLQVGYVWHLVFWHLSSPALCGLKSLRIELVVPARMTALWRACEGAMLSSMRAARGQDKVLILPWAAPDSQSDGLSSGEAEKLEKGDGCVRKSRRGGSAWNIERVVMEQKARPAFGMEPWRPWGGWDLREVEGMQNLLLA